MTLATTLSKNDFTASSLPNQEFDTDFIAVLAADVVVYTVDANGVPTLQTLSTNYTVSGLNVASGFKVKWVGDLTEGTKVWVERWVPPTQGTDYGLTGAVPVATIESDLDRLYMVVQQLIERLGGAAFTFNAIDFMGRLATDIDVWDAESDIISNVKDPLLAQDAATKAYADAIVASAGNVVAPLIGEVGYRLQATGAGTWAWVISHNVIAPVNVTDDGKFLKASGGDDSWQKIVLGDVSGAVAADVDRVPAVDSADTLAYRVLPANRNLVINGDFRIAQRGTTFNNGTTPNNNDGNYLLDRCILLSDGNDIVDIIRHTDAPTHLYHSMQAVVQTTGKKWGYLWPIERGEWAQLLGKRASASFYVKTTAAKLISNVRLGIITWDGLADLITSDVVDGSNWGAAGVNPTLLSAPDVWAYQNTPANLAVTTSWARHKVENVLIPTTDQNGALFIWVDDDDGASGDELFISGVKLEEGNKATPYEHDSMGKILADVERYYQTIKLGWSGDSTVDVDYHAIQSLRVLMFSDISCPKVQSAASSTEFSDPTSSDFNTASSDSRQVEFRLTATGTGPGAFWSVLAHLEAEM